MINKKVFELRYHQTGTEIILHLSGIFDKICKYVSKCNLYGFMYSSGDVQ